MAIGTAAWVALTIELIRTGVTLSNKWSDLGERLNRGDDVTIEEIHAAQAIMGASITELQSASQYDRPDEKELDESPTFETSPEVEEETEDITSFEEIAEN